jgi:dihydroneopterin aldolase
MDKIQICDLEVETNIGVTTEERARAQRVLVSVELERDLAEAGRSDADSTTTDYAEVAAAIRREAGARTRKLIEALATDVAGVILERKWAVAVTVQVKKFSIPGSKYVAVEIYRTQ